MWRSPCTSIVSVPAHRPSAGESCPHRVAHGPGSRSAAARSASAPASQPAASSGVARSTPALGQGQVEAADEPGDLPHRRRGPRRHVALPERHPPDIADGPVPAVLGPGQVLRDRGDQHAFVGRPPGAPGPTCEGCRRSRSRARVVRRLGPGWSPATGCSIHFTTAASPTTTSSLVWSTVDGTLARGRAPRGTRSPRGRPSRCRPSPSADTSASAAPSPATARRHPAGPTTAGTP